MVARSVRRCVETEAVLDECVHGRAHDDRGRLCVAQTIEQRAKTRAQAAAVLRARTMKPTMLGKVRFFSRDDDQRNGENGNGICVERTFTCALYSATIFTPIFFTLYRLQDKYITAGSPVFVAAKKTVCSLLFEAFRQIPFFDAWHNARNEGVWTC